MTEGKSPMNDACLDNQADLCFVSQQQTCFGTLYLYQHKFKKNFRSPALFLLAFQVVHILYILHPCMSTVLPQGLLGKQRILLDQPPVPLHHIG